MVQLIEIEHFLNHFFATESEVEPQGIYSDSNRSIKRLGLALQPFPGLNQWVVDKRLDGVFLHRPWKLNLDQFPPDVGVISYHFAFDQKLALGFNPRLAIALSLTNIETFGEKEGRMIGMIGTVLHQSFEQYCQQVKEVFGGLEKIQLPVQIEVDQVAIGGAMNDSLVREAAERSVQLYITGQFRQPAELAVANTGIGVIAVGHSRSEQWALRALASVLRERWANLEVVVFTPDIET